MDQETTDIEKGLAPVRILPKITGEVRDSMKIDPTSVPFLQAKDIYSDGGKGPDGTYCLQGWAAKSFKGKLKKDYSMKGPTATFVVDLLDEAAKAFAEVQEGYGTNRYRGWDKGIGFAVAYPLSEHKGVVAEIWNLTMERLGAVRPMSE